MRKYLAKVGRKNSLFNRKKPPEVPGSGKGSHLPAGGERRKSVEESHRLIIINNYIRVLYKHMDREKGEFFIGCSKQPRHIAAWLRENSGSLDLALPIIFIKKEGFKPNLKVWLLWGPPLFPLAGSSVFYILYPIYPQSLLQFSSVLFQTCIHSLQKIIPLFCLKRSRQKSTLISP